MVKIPGGKTWIGTDVKWCKEQIKEHPNSANWLAAETPRSQVDVPAFYISPTEVTNEMYLRFVKATGAFPPANWAKISSEQRLKAIEEGKQKFGPSYVLDATRLAAWWELHWQDPDKTWEMPPEIALEPVVYVNRKDAEAYCAWAGLRLPTEEEWVRAARGDKKWDYPYGEDFDPKRIGFEATKPRRMAYKILPVNSFPANASPYGCVDMVGNVYELTASGFHSLPGFKTFRVRPKGLDPIDVAPNWDSAAAVIKGGAYNQKAIAERIGNRPGINPLFRSPFVGFRVAASAKPVLDAMKNAALGIQAALLGEVPEQFFNVNEPTGLERRRYADLATIAAKRKKPLKVPATEPPAGYAIFDGYDNLGVLPVRELAFPSLDRLDREAMGLGAVFVGMIHSTLALKTPNLPAGSYVLAYLPELEEEKILALGAALPPKLMEKHEEDAASAKATDGKEEAPPRKGPDVSGLVLEPKTQYLLFVDNDNVARGAVDLHRVIYVSSRKARHGTTLNLDRKRIDFSMVAPSKGSRAFVFEFSVVPISPKGDVIRQDYWSGEFQTRLPKEGS